VNDNPQPGDFGLVSIPGGVGFLIRVGQWLNGNGFKNYEHAFIVLDAYSLLEAMPGGAKVSSLSKYAGSNVRYSTVSLTDVQRSSIVAQARKLQGVPYSFLDYFAIAAKRFNLKLPWLDARVKSSKHMICSQIVAKLYDDNDSQLTNEPPYLVDPIMLLPYTE
jgi:uncharacterized protein YycO